MTKWDYCFWGFFLCIAHIYVLRVVITILISVRIQSKVTLYACTLITGSFYRKWQFSFFRFRKIKQLLEHLYWIQNIQIRIRKKHVLQKIQPIHSHLCHNIWPSHLVCHSCYLIIFLCTKKSKKITLRKNVSIRSNTKNTYYSEIFIFALQFVW